jgi:hypothetical protein
VSEIATADAMLAALVTEDVRPEGSWRNVATAG